MVGQVLAQHQLQCREAASDRCQDPGQQVGPQCRDHPEDERTGHGISASLGDLENRVGLLQGRSRPLDNGLAQRRDGHGLVGPLQQGHAEPSLQLLKLRAQGRLADVAELGGTAEMTLLGDCHQISEIPEVHIGL